MRDIKHAKHMIHKAKKDFNALLGMKADFTFFDDEVFGFHAQQAVEKIIKAYLSVNGVKYSKIHDIKELISLLKDNQIDFPGQFSQFIILNPFAVEYRYESIEDESENLNREQLIKNISQLLKFVEDNINKFEE